MPLTFTEEINDVWATTLRHIRPTIADAFFSSRALFVRLYQRNRIMIDGGREIVQNILKDAPPGGSHGRGDELDISKRDVLASLRFPWKHYYAAVTEDAQDHIENAGAAQIADLARIRLEAARHRIEDDVGGDLYGQGTANSSKVLTGLRAAFDNGDTVASYGGITRATTGVGSLIRGTVSTTGGAVTLPHLTTQLMAATRGTAKPDLIVTTRTLWGALHDSIQPQQRFISKAGEQMAEAGFDVLSWQGADIVHDDKCPSGEMYFCNTSTLYLAIHATRNFTLHGPFEPANIDQATTRLHVSLAFWCDNPRLNAVSTGLTT